MKIYVLGLKNGKYYIGRTNNYRERLLKHQTKSDSCWVKLYPMERVVEVVDGDVFDEDKFVIKYMDIHGVENVRGGTYSNATLTFDQMINIYKQLRNAKNECLACGKDGHFISQCKTIMCYRCGRSDHTVYTCFATTHFYNGKLDGCYRCGRSDHWAIRCNRTKDVFGKILTPRQCVVM